jgi:hypothetical protein
MSNDTHDRYANCEKKCWHELAQGMLTTDLSHDGPDAEFADAWLTGEQLTVIGRLMRDWQAQV